METMITEEREEIIDGISKKWKITFKQESLS